MRTSAKVRLNRQRAADAVRRATAAGACADDVCSALRIRSDTLLEGHASAATMARLDRVVAALERFAARTRDGTGPANASQDVPRDFRHAFADVIDTLVVRQKEDYPFARAGYDVAAERVRSLAHNAFGVILASKAER